MAVAENNSDKTGIKTRGLFFFTLAIFEVK
jgi:hypothetical protein